MKTLLPYLKNYKIESVLAPLFKMLEAAFELIVPLVVAAIIDKGIGGGNIRYIASHIGIMMLLGVIGLTCSVTAQYFAAKAAVGFATGLRSAMFAHIQRLSYAKLDEAGTATLITRMTSDVNQVQNGVNMFLRLFLRSPFIVIGACVMAFYVDAKAATVFVIGIPILALVVFGIIFGSIPLYKKVQASLDRVMLSTRENLSGIRVIRAFHRESQEVADFAEKNGALTGLQLFAGKISALLNPLTYVIINSCLIVLLYAGAQGVYVGRLSGGNVVALVNYMSQILVELVKLANLIVILTKAMACASRIEDTMLVEEGMRQVEMKERGDMQAREATDANIEMATDGTIVDDNKNGTSNKIECDTSVTNEVTKEITGNSVDASHEIATAPMETEASEVDIGQNAVAENIEYISLNNVGFAYHPGGEEALSDITFSVKKGETIGIIGGTGSGKSTLVQLLPRFYDITRGELKINDTRVSDYDPKELKALFGYVPQKAALFKGTIRENLLFSDGEASREALEEAIAVAQAKEFIDAKEGGLEAMVEQGGRNLSGGQKQRLTIARALVRRPQILVLDDSCSALDYATDAAFRKALAGLSYRPTTFIVSQRTASIQHADQILVLEDGHMVGLGTHDQLLKSCQVYREIYDSQYHEEVRHG